MTMNVEEICRSFIAKKVWPRDEEEIEELWKPISGELELKEQTQLLHCLAKNDNVFKWLRLISHLLPDLASEDPAFVDLVEIVVDKVKGDMAQGVFIRSLVSIGEKDPEKGIDVYSQLIEVSNDSVIHYSGLILGGAAKKRFDEVFGMIKEGLQKGKISVKVACLRALRVAFETEGEAQFPSEILQILENLSTSESPPIRTEVIQAYIDFDKFDAERCEDKLLEIASTGNSLARLSIVDRLLFDSLENQSKEIEILKICAQDNDVNVLGRIAWVLSRKGQAFLDDSLGIIKILLKKREYFSIPSFSYCLKELCKDKTNTCMETFASWINSDTDPVFRFQVSKLIEEISSSSSE